ncbi:uncharacterized protein F4822DRAFT_419989 [Hypoxylon trugodes]|uniref:uncharacterized protein n=1 Tax=Hypoxylon trugodes TaxID=326681 RepID=UPI0021986E1E|nr:uncharacterized protein F4822DRAFT_419989 [Hypoxylon trugodes]KAI1383278.1 hypothetical protein F4822DRAFT_419989 [Hypoxylon trugodes]
MPRLPGYLGRLLLASSFFLQKGKGSGIRTNGKPDCKYRIQPSTSPIMYFATQRIPKPLVHLPNIIHRLVMKGKK